MPTADRDQNHVPTALGVSSSDGTTPVQFRVNPATDKLVIDISAATPSVTMPSLDSLPRDDNRVTVAAGQDSTDSSKLLPVLVNPSSGRLLITK